MPTQSRQIESRGAISSWASNGYVWIFLGAVILRAVYLAQAFRNNELVGYPVVDESVYIRWARDIVAGKLLWSEAINYTPGHPTWLAAWLALFGFRPVAHFGVFLLLGSIQAVLIGKTAEILWHRGVGLVAAAFAATYWPLIIFEASYFAEPFAIFTLTIAVYLVVRWEATPPTRPWRLLAWAGFCLGWSILARANALLCIPVIVAWVAWRCWREASPSRMRHALAAACAILLPVAALTVPVAYWNWKITGRAMLRTDGWLSMYLGNDPAMRGRVVPAGVRWRDFVYRPVRAGFTEPNEKESYWRDEVARVIRDDPKAWLRLMGRKALMLIGRFEVSQETDIAVFRKASAVLSLPIWPGWGALAPLAAAAIVSMLAGSRARRGILLALLAGAYFASIVPVQAAARYRLPLIVPLIPLAAWTVVAAAEAWRSRDRRTIALIVGTIVVTAIVVWPDYLHLHREKHVNHWFLVGLKRAASDDRTGAYAAFAKGAAWNPADPDCPLRMGHIARSRGNLDDAERHYRTSLALFPRAHEAMLGLGECALQMKRADDALRQVREALEVAPNNFEALDLAARAYGALGQWTASALARRQMRSYPTCPASIFFSEASAWSLAGKPREALPLYDAISENPAFSESERSRAAFLGGALAWRVSYRPEPAMQRWKPLAARAPGYFQSLAAVLTGAQPDSSAAEALPERLAATSLQYRDYALALSAWMQRRAGETRQHLERVIAARNAPHLPPNERNILEIWALDDVKTLPPRP